MTKKQADAIYEMEKFIYEEKKGSPTNHFLSGFDWFMMKIEWPAPPKSPQLPTSYSAALSMQPTASNVDPPSNAITIPSPSFLSSS